MSWLAQDIITSFTFCTQPLVYVCVLDFSPLSRLARSLCDTWVSHHYSPKKPSFQDLFYLPTYDPFHNKASPACDRSISGPTGTAEAVETVSVVGGRQLKS